MPIESVNQNINVRYGSEVTSSGVNEKISEIFGNKGKIEGLNILPSSGLTCVLSPGTIVINGTSIEETQNISVDIPANSSGVDVTHYLYATYVHEDGGTCTYDLTTSTTANQNALLLSTIIIPDSASEIIEENISNEPVSSKSKDAVVFADLKNKDVQDVRSLSIGGKTLTVSDENILLDGQTIWTEANDGDGSGLDADKLDSAEKSTDGTLSSNSDSKIPTEKAIKTFVGSNYIKTYVGPSPPDSVGVEHFWLDTSV